MFDAVIFDCDGVLIDSEIAGLDDSAQFLQQHGFSWTAADLVQFTGLRQDVLVQNLTSEYSKIHKREPTEQKTTEIIEGLIAARRANRDRVTAIAGVEPLLVNMGCLPAAIAVASSSQTEFLEEKLKRFALWEHFAPHVYSADRVDAGKPAPDIFLYTAERLGIAPDRCLVIEDSVNGVKAGIAAGMTVWGFTGGGHCFDGHEAGLLSAGAETSVTSHDALKMRITDLLAG